MLRRIVWVLALLCQAVAAQPLSLSTVQQAGSIIKYEPGSGRHRPGLCMEILRAVEKAEPGLHFTGLDQVVPLKRVERLLAESVVDVFFCLLKSPERERQWRYAPVPLYTIRHVIVQRADDGRHFDSVPDLVALSRRKPVLVMRGTALARQLVMAGVTIAEAATEREALGMLMLGRTDVVYGQDLNLQRHVSDAHLGDRLRFGRTSFQEEPQFLAMRADLPPDQAERLTRALRKLEKDGTLKQLADKYR